MAETACFRSGCKIVASDKTMTRLRGRAYRLASGAAPVGNHASNPRP
jgi:hypothetical protein